MVICSLDTLKESLKKRETKIKKKIVEVFNKLFTIKRGQGIKRSEWSNSWLWPSGPCIYLLEEHWL